MMTEQERLELIRCHVDGTASDEQTQTLEAELRTDAALRSQLLRYTNIDTALSSGRLSGVVAARSTQLSPSNRTKLASWISWGQATSAAAGVVLGLFCASAAWAVVGLRMAGPRVNESLLEESFESAEMQWPEGFPSQAGTWGGARGRIVGATSEIVPLDGGGMAELAPAEDTTLSYLDRVIDLRGYPQPEAHEVRQIEVTASFHAAVSGFQERYTLRAATFGEGPEEIQSKWVNVPWRELDGTTLTTSKRGLSAPSDADGWQTLSVMVEAPADASSMVISLAAGRFETSAPKTLHYLDNVHASLIISPRTTKPRNRRR